MESVNQHLGKMSKILFFYYYLPLFLTIRHHLFYVALSDDEGLYYFCCLGCEQQNICNDAGCQHNMHEVALLLYSSHSRKLIKKFLFQTFCYLYIVHSQLLQNKQVGSLYQDSSQKENLDLDSFDKSLPILLKGSLRENNKKTNQMIRAYSASVLE